MKMTLVHPSAPCTFYIDSENGDDSNDGSPTRPKKTVASAMESGAKIGDGLNLAARTPVTIPVKP